MDYSLWSIKSIHLFQENYEDGVLILINKNWQDLQQGLGKILEGLEKHDKLQDVLTKIVCTEMFIWKN